MRAFIPGAPLLDLDRFCLAAHALATHALCLFLFHVFYVCFALLIPKIPRSFYFSECEILTALPK